MTIAQLDWSLFVDCPECKEDFDCADQDDEGFITRAIFNNEWDKVKGTWVTCPKCKHHFPLTGVEY